MDRAWLERLQVHLRPAIREGLVDSWDDNQLNPGEDWRDAIDQALKRARVAVLLVSANFFASDFIAMHELPALLRAAEDEGATILPLILAPSRYSDDPSLFRFQSVNAPDRHLSKLRRWQQEEVLVGLTRIVLSALIEPRKVGAAGTFLPETVIDPPKHSGRSVESIYLFDELAAGRRGLIYGEWNALGAAQQRELEEHLVERLHDYRVSEDSLRAYRSLRFVLSRANNQKCRIRLAELDDQPDPKVREMVAWDLREVAWSLHYDPDKSVGIRSMQCLTRMLRDEVAVVVRNAMTSLAFFSGAGLRSSAWPDIDAVSLNLWDSPDESLVDGAMFYAAHVLRAHGNKQLRIDDLYPAFLEKMCGSSTTLRERAFFCIEKVTLHLTTDMLRTAIDVSRDVSGYNLGQYADCRAIRLWGSIADPQIEEALDRTWNEAELVALKNATMGRRTAFANEFRLTAEKMFQEYSLDARKNALLLLYWIGAAIPSIEHQGVLSIVTNIWRTDRRIPIRLIKDVTAVYVGEIPDNLREEIARFRQAEAEADRDLEEQD